MLAEVRELCLFHLITGLHRHGLNLGSASSPILLECEQLCVWPCGHDVIVLVKPVIVSPASAALSWALQDFLEISHHHQLQLCCDLNKTGVEILKKPLFFQILFDVVPVEKVPDNWTKYHTFWIAVDFSSHEFIFCCYM